LVHQIVCQQSTYPHKIGVSVLLSGVLGSRMFPVLLDIASRMSSELWDIDSTRIISLRS